MSLKGADQIISKIYELATTAIRVSIAGGTLPLSAPNSAGSISNQTVTTTPVTFAPPANARGFILQAMSPNTDNIRWCIGATASPTVGMLYEPGRDSPFVACSAAISVVAISGSQEVSVQWILSS